MSFEINEVEFTRIRELVDDDSTALGILFVRSMSDVDLLNGARDESRSGFRQVLAFAGKDTNPYWITSQCAVTAYERGLIDERELDQITD